MLTYLVPNYNNGSSSGSDTVIAEIGKDTITLAETQRLIQATVRGRQLPVEILPTYIPQMVDQMVTERAMAMEAERLGLQVSDAEMAEAIRQMVPSLFPDGKFVGKEAYAAMLAQQNMTIDQFESDLKRQVMVTRLRDIAMEGTIVTQAEIEAAFRKKNEKIKVEFVRLTADKYKAESQPTDAGTAGFLQGQHCALHGAREEEPDGSGRRPGQDGSHGQPDRRRPAAPVLAEPGGLPHAGACQGAPHPAQDAGQTGKRRSGDQGQGREPSQADQGRRGFRQTGQGKFRGSRLCR